MIFHSNCNGDQVPNGIMYFGSDLSLAICTLALIWHLVDSFLSSLKVCARKVSAYLLFFM